MKALIIKNIGIEGAGTLGSYLRKKGVIVQTVDLERGEKLPGTALEFSLVLVMGGPMNVYEENKYLYLAEEYSFIEKCLKSNIKTVGLCLGAQMIARVLGAKVRANSQKEIGWFEIELTAEGKSSELFNDLPERFKPFHWHGDTFDIPKEATRLAGSALCENQAFACGSALGLQFHIEIEGTNEVAKWCRLYKDEVTQELGRAATAKMIKASDSEAAAVFPIAEKFYDNLYSSISSGQ